MKRLCLILVVVLLLAQCCCAYADGNVNVEVMKADGVSVVVLTPEAVMLRARSLVNNAASDGRANFVLPEFLTVIEESAFEGIAAECVEISANVAAIERRAFADCKTLREIHIPATVLKVDDYALDGCEDVTVYGVKGTEAERFAAAAGFTFVDPNAEPETPVHPTEPETPPVELPLVPRR